MARYMFAIFAALLPADAAKAQILELEGSAHYEHFGEGIDSVADFDGDGLDDLLIGRPREIGAVCSEAGTPGFQIRSGVSGAILSERTSENNEHLGWPLARLGDVDGDGIDDFAVGSGGDYECWWEAVGARVYSGADGSELYWIDQDEWYDFFDLDIVALEDVDADGLADLVLFTGLASDPNLIGYSHGLIDVRSGADGASIWSEYGTTTNEMLGSYGALLGDWNGDGIGELAVGAANFTRVYDATSAAVLAQFSFSGELADPGDFDGDGSLDLVIGDDVISGATGSVIQSYPGWSVLVPAGDVDLDGTLDFLAGDETYLSNRGRAALLSGSSSNVIWTIREGAHGNALLGQTIAAVGDVSGDGQADFLLNAIWEEGSNGAYRSGRVWLYSLVGWPAPQRYCIAAANSASFAGAPILDSGSWALANNDLTLRCTDLPPNHFGLFYYGTNAVQTPFGNGYRCAGGFVSRLLPPLSSGAAGMVTRALEFTVPPLDSLAVGMTRHFQYWYRDVPAGGAFFNLSDGLSITFSY